MRNCSNARKLVFDLDTHFAFAINEFEYLAVAFVEFNLRSVLLDEAFRFEDGVVTVLTSKVEVGQGARTQITQAAAEEFRLPVDRIRLIMADTQQCPDDGGTAGSGPHRQRCRAYETQPRPPEKCLLSTPPSDWVWIGLPW